MKRSTQLLLIGTGIGAMAFLNLQNDSSIKASDEIEGNVYSSLEECLENGVARDTCMLSQNEALRIHQAEAPKYETQQDCESNFGEGQCNLTEQKTANGEPQRSYFSPLLTGFMLGHLMGNRQAARNTAYPLYGCGGQTAMAGAGGRCFSSRNGSRFTTPSQGGSAAPRIRIPASVMNGNTASRSVIAGRPASAPLRSRGGFGSSGRSFSFGG